MLKIPCHDNCLWRNNGCFKSSIHCIIQLFKSAVMAMDCFFLFCSVLLKLKLSEKRETGMSHLRGCFISLHFALSWITPLITLQDQCSLRLVKILTVNSCVKISNIWRFFEGGLSPFIILTFFLTGTNFRVLPLPPQYKIQLESICFCTRKTSKRDSLMAAIVKIVHNSFTSPGNTSGLEQRQQCALKGSTKSHVFSLCTRRVICSCLLILHPRRNERV